MTQGYIEAITPKVVSTGATMYDFQIAGRRLGAGKFPPKGFSVGDYVNYEVEERGNFLNLKAGSMSKATPPAGVPAPKAAPETPDPSATTAAAFAKADAKDEAYSRGASANTAIALLKILADTGSLPMPAKAAKDKQADLIYDIFKEYTGRIYKLTTGREFVDNETPASKPASGGSLADAEIADTSWDETPY